MTIGRRIVAALGLAGVIVAVILWQWLTAPVEWGPVDSMIRQAGQNLVSCLGSRWPVAARNTSEGLPCVLVSFVCRLGFWGGGSCGLRQGTFHGSQAEPYPSVTIGDSVLHNRRSGGNGGSVPFVQKNRGQRVPFRESFPLVPLGKGKNAG